MGVGEWGPKERARGYRQREAESWVTAQSLVPGGMETIFINVATCTLKELAQTATSICYI